MTTLLRILAGFGAFFGIILAIAIGIGKGIATLGEREASDLIGGPSIMPDPDDPRTFIGIDREYRDLCS